MQLCNKDVLYQDDYLVAVNKPVDLPVHKNDFMPADADYLTKLVGQLTDRPVFPVHRLDAKTSGLIVLAFSREVAAALAKQFEQRKVDKSYMLLCKGVPGEGVFTNEVLIKKKKKRQAARTAYKTITTIETGISYKQEENVAISLVKAMPETGRWHQLRQHFAFNRTDILGDTQHGDWTLNKIMTELSGVKRLLLHAESLTFQHPESKEKISLAAPLPEAFDLLLKQLAGCQYVAP
ncbi:MULTISPECIES: RluA family pseudouridine synthase [unclassified Carboxylicivirga]|uniref:RluA family pseudouridine synthase n=1 Tax=Carboxylicivirga TaxID=1628153 RepID=UPI003D336DFE